ncbi:MAG: hypothetical protein N3A58_06550 [Spirochaetes bacterium]|nr:hypothetical protein [Spirochaetota bacterium]
MAKTRAIDFLQKNNINFEVFEYNFEKKGAEFAAEALSVPLESMIKSIVIKDIKNYDFYFCLIGGDKEIDLKKLAFFLKTKKVELAEVDEAQRITGYLVGGISPFGSKNKLKVIIDKKLSKFEYVFINGGQRGVILKIKYIDLIKLLDPLIIEI